MENEYLNIFGNYGELVLSIIGVFSVIATMVPAPKEDSGKVYKIFYSLLSWLAANIGKAKNVSNTSTTTTSK